MREKFSRGNVTLNPNLMPPVIESAACFDEFGEAVLFSRGGNAQSSLVRSGVEFSDTHKSEEITVATRLWTPIYQGTISCPSM